MGQFNERSLSILKIDLYILKYFIKWFFGHFLKKMDKLKENIKIIFQIIFSTNFTKFIFINYNFLLFFSFLLYMVVMPLMIGFSKWHWVMVYIVPSIKQTYRYPSSWKWVLGEKWSPKF